MQARQRTEGVEVSPVFDEDGKMGVFLPSEVLEAWRVQAALRFPQNTVDWARLAKQKRARHLYSYLMCQTPCPVAAANGQLVALDPKGACATPEWLVEQREEGWFCVPTDQPIHSPDSVRFFTRLVAIRSYLTVCATYKNGSYTVDPKNPTRPGLANLFKIYDPSNRKDWTVAVALSKAKLDNIREWIDGGLNADERPKCLRKSRYKGQIRKTQKESVNRRGLLLDPGHFGEVDKDLEFFLSKAWSNENSWRRNTRTEEDLQQAYQAWLNKGESLTPHDVNPDALMSALSETVKLTPEQLWVVTQRKKEYYHLLPTRTINTLTPCATGIDALYQNLMIQRSRDGSRRLFTGYSKLIEQTVCPGISTNVLFRRNSHAIGRIENANGNGKYVAKTKNGFGRSILFYIRNWSLARAPKYDYALKGTVAARHYRALATAIAVSMSRFTPINRVCVQKAKNLRLDLDAAREAIPSLAITSQQQTQKNLDERALRHTAGLIEQYQTAEHDELLFRTETSGRFHYLLTQVARRIRPFVRYELDGKLHSTTAIDICQCHPVILFEYALQNFDLPLEEREFLTSLCDQDQREELGGKIPLLKWMNDERGATHQPEVEEFFLQHAPNFLKAFTKLRSLLMTQVYNKVLAPRETEIVDYLLEKLFEDPELAPHVIGREHDGIRTTQEKSEEILSRVNELLSSFLSVPVSAKIKDPKQERLDALQEDLDEGRVYLDPSEELPSDLDEVGTVTLLSDKDFEKVLSLSPFRTEFNEDSGEIVEGDLSKGDLVEGGFVNPVRDPLSLANFTSSPVEQLKRTQWGPFGPHPGTPSSVGSTDEPPLAQAAPEPRAEELVCSTTQLAPTTPPAVPPPPKKRRRRPKPPSTDTNTDTNHSPKGL